MYYDDCDCCFHAVHLSNILFVKLCAKKVSIGRHVML